MSEKVYAAVQPKHGDGILACSHIAEGRQGNFFALNASPGEEPQEANCSRPDGTKIKVKWIAICDLCDKEHHRNPIAAVTGDAVWQGDEPAIKVYKQ